ncbi:hypothetical protein BGZ76_003982 [Entomortierella beljakovae]|nr:hypothetical protein BGZ76_003982 [Entomortierella beljakovae]
MGVGKSYLALFLAAKAYSEGWLVLYVSDASELVQPDLDATGSELCKRFFALNKDILTVRDYEKFWVGRERDSLTARSLAATILSTLLSQVDKKTFTIIDEHGKLFDENTRKPNLFEPLVDIHSWNPSKNGARVIYTGTAHAGFELVVLTGPLSDYILDKLLGSSPIPPNPDVLEAVKTTTRNVPRELVKLVKYLVEHLQDFKNVTDKDILEHIRRFELIRSEEFYRLAQTHFNKLKDDQQMDQRTALSIMFQLRSQEILNPINKVFTEPRFMNLGLVYRFKVGGDTKYKFLCPAAKEGLLELYRTMPLPVNKLAALEKGNGTGDDFEEVFFRYVMWYNNFSLNTTDLVGKPKSPINIQATSFDTMDKPFTKARENTFRRFYERYPRFDFVYNRTFFQLSMSSFNEHDRDSKEILKAFVPVNTLNVDDEQGNGGTSSNTKGKQKRRRNDPNQDETSDDRNQIEVYLDTIYGGKHDSDDAYGKI